MPGVTVNRIDQVPLKENLSHSIYLITVNTNRTEEVYIKALKYAIAAFEMHLEDCIEILPKEHGWNDTYIRQVELGFKTETGPEKGFQHTHGLLSIDHVTKIRLNYKVTSNLFLEAINNYVYERYKGDLAYALMLDTIHTDFKLIRGGKFDAYEYMMKSTLVPPKTEHHITADEKLVDDVCDEPTSEDV